MDMEKLVAVRITSDKLGPDVKPGDVLIIDPGAKYEMGDIVLMGGSDGFMLAGRIIRCGNGYKLQHIPMSFGKKEIIGKAIRLQREL